jgi:hypothetical protein
MTVHNSCPGGDSVEQDPDRGTALRGPFYVQDFIALKGHVGCVDGR